MVHETRLEQMAIRSTEHSFGLSSNQIKPIPLCVETGKDVQEQGWPSNLLSLKIEREDGQCKSWGKMIHLKTNTVWNVWRKKIVFHWQSCILLHKIHLRVEALWLFYETSPNWHTERFSLQESSSLYLPKPKEKQKVSHRYKFWVLLSITQYYTATGCYMNNHVSSLYTFL